MEVTNIFSEPTKYINEIIQNVHIPKEEQKKFEGKSLASIFLTKFCDAGCSHCFFKSGKRIEKAPQEQYEFSDDGITKFIDFINQSNNGYLLVIGGGEPFKKFEHVKRIVNEVKTDRLILVTNGMWAQDYIEAKKTIFQIYSAYQERTTPTKLILRLSVDKWHAEKLGYSLINNIINIYKQYFKEEEDFELQLHTLIDDPTIDILSKERKDFTIIRTQETGISDNEEVIKISPYRCRLTFNDGYVIYVGIAKTFYSTLSPNLNNKDAHLEKAIKIFDDDMEYSAFDNPSVIINKNGTYGLNFWVNYNGNVALWGNQQLTDLRNIYCDNYDDIIHANLDNIISYSFLDKGYKHRLEIIDKVNHNAVIRSKAINIRDYAGASILEEKKTTLFYAILVIKEYLQEKKSLLNDIENLSQELKTTIHLDEQELIKQYNQSPYNIITEYMEKPNFNEDEWKDLFLLIQLGHYDVSEQQLDIGLDYYNKHSNNKLHNLDEIKVDFKEHYERLNEKLTFMQEKAKQLCINKTTKQRYKTPSAVILILSRNNNGKEQVLLQKRKNTGYMDGYYDLGVSGHVEENETLKITLARETFEEIGVKINISDMEFISMIHDIKGTPYYNAYFKVTKWEGEPKINEPDKIEEIKWCNVDELPENLIDIRKNGIKNYLGNIYYSEIA